MGMGPQISVTSHIVVFASFIEEGLPLCVVLELLHIEERKNMHA